MEGTPGQLLDFEVPGPGRFRGAFFSFWRLDRLLEVLYLARRLYGRDRLSLLLGHSRWVLAESIFAKTVFLETHLECA